MLRAIRMINEAKAHRGHQTPLTVDLHPNRPDFRGFVIPFANGLEYFSLEADPSFDEVEKAGASVAKNKEPHTVLDDMFLVSGEIPRVTPYEVGIRNGIRLNGSTKSWEKDELIMDERFLMCNLKGTELIKPQIESRN